MTKFNSIIKTGLAVGVFTFIFNLSGVEISAWGGYSHWEIGQRISDLSNYTYDKKLSFSSGSLLADIGKLSWDRKYISSDSEEFSNKMVSIASDENSAYFANGWLSHYKQDTFGALSNINGGPSSYRVKCGWVDEYLRDFKNINSPINNKCDVLVNYDLIRSTYLGLHNFNPSNKEIDKEIKKLYIACDLQIMANLQGWDSGEIEQIERELNRTVGISMNKNNHIKYAAAYTNEQENIKDSDVNTINKVIEDYMIELEKHDIIRLNKIKSNTNKSYIVNYSIQDDEEYKETLIKMQKDLNDNGVDITKI